jgi:hypothetical protein
MRSIWFYRRHVTHEPFGQNGNFQTSGKVVSDEVL